MTAFNADDSSLIHGPAPTSSFGWLGEALSLYRANVGLWLAAALLTSFAPSLLTALVLLLIHGPHRFLGTPGLNQPPALWLGLAILNTVYTAYLLAGACGMALKQVRGETPTFADLFGGRAVLPMLGLLLLFQIVVNLGLSLLLVPGVLFFGLLLPAFALVADGVSLGEALRVSVRAMSRDLRGTAIFALVLGLLVLVSALPLGAGLLVTLPMCWLISALAYRDVVGLPEARPLLSTDGLPEGLLPGALTFSPGDRRVSLTGETLDGDGNVIRDLEPVE